MSDGLVIGTWFGLMCGVFHLLPLFVDRYVRGRILMVGPQILWMAPLAYVLIFFPLALFLGLAINRIPRVFTFSVCIAGFAWLSAFGLLLPFTQLSPLASAMLAAG